jgi:hypothetical protein
MAAKKKFYRGVLFTAASMVLLVSPNLFWFYLQRDVYFETGATKLSVGALISLLFVFAMLRGAFKNLDKRFATFISLFVILSITWFMEAVIQDLFWIVTNAILGYSLYLVLSLIAKRDLSYYKGYRNEKSRIEARKEAQEEQFGSV